MARLLKNIVTERETKACQWFLEGKVVDGKKYERTVSDVNALFAATPDSDGKCRQMAVPRLMELQAKMREITNHPNAGEDRLIAAPKAPYTGKKRGRKPKAKPVATETPTTENPATTETKTETNTLPTIDAEPNTLANAIATSTNAMISAKTKGFQIVVVDENGGETSVVVKHKEAGEDRPMGVAPDTAPTPETPAPAAG